MKKLFIFLLFVPLYSVGQNFTIYEIAKLVNLKDAEFLMYKKGLRNIGVDKNYKYQKIRRGIDNQICKKDPLNKECNWWCYSVMETIYSKFPKSNIDWEHYKIVSQKSSKFAMNYDSEKQIAASFINIDYTAEKDNGNCNKTFGKTYHSIDIDIQFNDKSEFKYLKNSIIDNAEYEETNVWGIDFKYYDSDNDRNISFRIREEDNYGEIEIRL